MTLKSFPPKSIDLTDQPLPSEILETIPQNKITPDRLIYWCDRLKELELKLVKGVPELRITLRNHGHLVFTTADKDPITLMKVISSFHYTARVVTISMATAFYNYPEAMVEPFRNPEDVNMNKSVFEAVANDPYHTISSMGSDSMTVPMSPTKTTIYDADGNPYQSILPDIVPLFNRIRKPLINYFRYAIDVINARRL